MSARRRCSAGRRPDRISRGSYCGGYGRQAVSWRSRTEPDDECGCGDGAEVDVAALVEPRRNRAEGFQLVDRPFDGVSRRRDDQREHPAADVRTPMDCLTVYHYDYHD